MFPAYAGRNPGSPRSALLVALWLGLLPDAGPLRAQDEDTFQRWEPSIRAFEARDADRRPPRDGILFAGSSSIRLWNLARHFPDLPVINRGFGGSQIADSVHFMERLIFPHRPGAVVLYAGDNDIAAGKSPETVFADFRAFVDKLHRELPETSLVYVAIKPSIRRWSLVEPMREANLLIRNHCSAHDGLYFADIDTPMIGANGEPDPSLFVEDGLHLNEAGYRLWTSVITPILRRAWPTGPGNLWVATAQFPVSADVAANADWIRKQMRVARREGSDVVHFPECALSGYAGVDHPTMEGFDWSAQRAELTSILDLARDLELWVILGAAHRLGGEHRPHNSLYVISPEGSIVDRYDKRFCTGGDLLHYSPGDHFVLLEINGVSCGLLICYDIRFPELFREYHKLGAQIIFHSFYNARQREGAIHPRIMPPTAQARAATNYLFLSVANSSAAHSWESLFVTPDGLIDGRRLELDRPGVMVNLADTASEYYDASRPYRLECIEGKLNSGEVVRDPQSADRRSY